MKTRTLVCAALFAALSFLVRQFSFPFFLAPFLKIEFSEMPVLLAGVFLGPGTGLCVQAIKDVLLVLLRGSALWGVFSDFVCTSSLMLAFWLVWQYPWKNALVRIIAATSLSILFRCVISIPLNYLVLSMQFGNSIDYITSILAPAIIPFNAVKSLFNIMLYVPIYHLLCKSPLFVSATPLNERKW